MTLALGIWIILGEALLGAQRCERCLHLWSSVLPEDRYNASMIDITFVIVVKRGRFLCDHLGPNSILTPISFHKNIVLLYIVLLSGPN